MSHDSLTVALFSVSLMLFATALAYIDKRLLPSQMMKYRAIRGFPALSNGALWGNIFLMPWVFYLAGDYRGQWTLGERETSLFIGAIVTFYMFKVVYKNGRFDDAWAGAGEIHLAGGAAMVYGTLLIMTLILFYVFSNAKRADIWIVGVLLLLYVPLANHWVLNTLNEWRGFIWCPSVFAEEERPMKILVRAEAGVIVITAAKLLFPGVWW